MNWIPLWNRTLNNRKVQRLGGEVFKTWINLLCLASIEDKDGVLPDVDQMSFDLRIDATVLGSHVRELVDSKLIDKTKGGYRVHDWESWQLKSYSSTDRVKRHRERLRSESPHETLQERCINVSETPVKHSGDAETEPPDDVIPITKMMGLDRDETLHETLQKRDGNGDETKCNVLEKRIENIYPPYISPPSDQKQTPKQALLVTETETETISSSRMDPEVKRVADQIDQVTANPFWSRWVYERATMGDSPEWIRLAILRAIDRKKLTPPYVSAILAGFKANGVDEPAVSFKSGGSSSGKPRDVPLPPYVQATGNWKRPTTRKAQA